MKMHQLRSLGESPKGNRVLSPSAALCHLLAFSCSMCVSLHAGFVESGETNVVKGLGS